MSDGRPAGRMDSGPYEHRERGAAVRIRCHRHEGIVLANDHHVPGLGKLAATWELVRADGRILAAPAELPDLRPGETAAVPLPFGLPRDGGAAWLTLRVLTATDEPGALCGTELCAPRIPLLGHGRRRSRDHRRPRLVSRTRRARRAHRGRECRQAAVPPGTGREPPPRPPPARPLTSTAPRFPATSSDFQ
ncbi:DUF4981 domain-containing protein [Streptomyces lasalocidi]